MLISGLLMVSVRQGLIDRLKTAGSRVVLDLLFDGKEIELRPGRGDIAGVRPDGERPARPSTDDGRR